MVTHVKNITEGISVAEAGARPVDYSRARSDNLDMQEGVTRAFYKVLAAEFEFDDAITRVIRKWVTETVTVKDTRRSPAKGTIFDLVLRSDALSLDDLKTMADSPPVGYTPFQNFYPGDYEYQHAMVGVRVRTTDVNNQAGILGLKLNIDVPDVTDRGSAEVGPTDTAGKTVSFSKQFTIPPEVNVVFAGGATAAVAEITSVTTTDFTFILRNVSSPATLVTGEVTWAAIGR